MINEFLADPPDSATDPTVGDANHDGVRSSSDDEFVELVNTTTHDIDVSGYQILTRGASGTTDTVRFTFALRTIMPACTAAVVFGGGTFNPSNPAFGGAQVFKPSSGSLSLTNTGGAITLRDQAGAIVNLITYGGSTGLNGNAGQSLTRSPDLIGSLKLHQSAIGSGGRLFSPGTQVNGAPFNSCTPAIARMEVLPSSATIDVGTQQQFAARAFDAGNNEVPGVIFSWQSSNTNVATIDPNGLATGMAPGSTEIRATGRGVQSRPASLTVRQMPPLPGLSINDVAANESNGGTATLSFTVSLSAPAPTSGVTFDISTQNNTATAASGDYLSRSLTSQTIPSGQQTYTFDVAVNGDTLVESNETFFVNVTNVANATVSDGQGQGTIQNDDTANLIISQLYGGGGNTGAQFTNDFVEIFNRGTTTVSFVVTPYSVQYAGATASFSSSKVDLTSGSMTPGQYFLVQLSGGANGAPLPTPDATGSIAMAATAGKVALVAGTTALTGSGCPLAATVADFVGYGTTADCLEGLGRAPAPGNTTADLRKAGGCTDSNDNAADFLVSAPFPRNTSAPLNNCVAGTPPNLTINDVTVTEGNSGTTIAAFTVSLSAPAPSTDITFDIATQNNTATTVNNDYVAKTLTNQLIPAGQQTYSFTVTLNGDTAVENDETFFVNVTNVSGATVTDGQGVGTIQNDDLPSLSVNDVLQNEGNGGATTFSFSISLSAAAPAGGVTFDIATQDNTATVGDNDYVARALTSQTIPAGSSTYNFDVTVNGDTIVELNETYFVNVTNVSGATVVDGQGQGTILNDDSPTLTINDVSQSEGNSGTTTFTFTVISSLPAPAGGITFDIATADGTAQDDTPPSEDNDYVARSLTAQTISAGNTTYAFDVTVNGDTLVEANENFFVNLTSISNATVLDGQGQGTIQNNDTPLLVISQVYGGGGNTSATYTNDFIEIFNRGTTTVNFSVTPYSVQYAAATSNFSTNKTDITSGILLPGHYFLVREASGGAVGAALPAPDATGTIAMAATAGKVALVTGTTALTGNGCPLGASIADFLGYGSTANCFETARIPVSGTNPNARSVIRTVSCTDTNNNSADFSNPVTAPVARNTATTPAPCP